MKPTKARSAAFIYLIGFSLLFIVNLAEGAGDKLSEKQYVDPKGYFKILPPAGWQPEEFRNDPRGKVKFVRSSPSGTMMQVIAQASPFQNLKELLEDSERAGARLKQKYAASVVIEKAAFAEVQAMRFTFEIPNKLKQIQVQFILEGIHYTIAYGAPPNSYEQFLPLALASFETFEPVLKKTSKGDSIKHVVASKLRTAKNLIQLGQSEYALTIINEGLSLDQNNKDLLELKKSITGK